MTLKIVPKNDNRTEVQKELDDAVKAFHIHLGDKMTGFVVIGWCADKLESMTSYNAGNIDADFLGEYAKQTILNEQLCDIIEFTPDA